jgi:beta-N-acetylhexosaminidase
MVSSQMMIAFAGRELPDDVARAIGERPIAGVTLFYEHNVGSVAQVRDLTAQLQTAARAAGYGPLLIAADQEGGQLIALGDETTQFAGPMAIGAAGSPELAERVARATALELRAVGVNVNYAPCCDLATNPANAALGIRSFGDDPETAGELVAATVRGLQAEGVAATLKHFPGAGDIDVDTHHALATVEADTDTLLSRELSPFRAGIDAGAHVVMAGHFALPAFDGEAPLPASLSRAVITDLLREEMGFEGLAITDALDMRALAQGAAQVVDVIMAVRAGEDLLLGTADAELIARMEEGLSQAELRGLTDRSARETTERRLRAIRAWLSAFDQPDLEIVGCPEHQALAAELAGRSITLVRNDDRLLPLRLSDAERVAVIQPQPTNMTPADTSAKVPPLLAEAIRTRHRATDSFVVEHSPSDSEIHSLCARLADHDVIILGTTGTNLVPAQAALAGAVLALGKPTINVALRTPWDITTYPAARTYVCSYGILRPTIEALAGALFGEQPFAGHLPVEISGLHDRGHGLTS